MIGLGMQELVILGVVALVAIGAIAAVVVAAGRSSRRADDRHRPD